MVDAPILLDVSRLIWRQWTGRLPTGIDRVCLAYLEHFRHRAQAVVQFRRFRRILGADDSVRLFDLLLNGSNRYRARLLMILAASTLRSDRNTAGQIYLNVGHTGLDSIHLVPWLASQRLRPIFLIHDLIPITHPSYCREGEAERHGTRMCHAMLSAHGIIVNSNATELDLARFAHDRGLPTPPSIVAWLGIDNPALPAPAAPPGHAYFVMVGTIEARKNHLLILNAWSDLVARLGEQAPRLVIIGQRGWEAQAVFELLDNPGALAGHVQELGSCDDSAMNQLIAGARALLMPSFVEGFGLPLVEALDMGTPVIASDLAVFHEIAGDIPEYLDPTDRASWTEALIEYGTNGRRREAQVERMAQFEAPRWNGHFERVEAFLGSI